ncbi:SBBP repeat-containing protein [Wukongibacter baidiensis]|uniref:DUF7948 domain-containing protein n=1 Tax=Wukongibacter baidiensis TaxID=1723361 RepID=UPI003D7F3657
MSIILKKAEDEQGLYSSKTISVAEKARVLSNLSKMPMMFITNAGQIDHKVKYYAKGGNYGFYFTKEEVVLSFVKRTSREIFDNSASKGDISKEEEKEIGVALSMQFIGANPDVKIEGQIRGSGRVNYIKGNDPEKWYTDLLTYEKVVYKELWQGIDLVFYGAKGQLKYEFVVQPGADSQDIKLSYKGAEDISLDEKGNLLIKNDLGVLIDERPVSYQEIEGRNVTLDSSFVVKKHENGESFYSFEVEKGYNPDYPIIIDPGLIYSTYLGGIGSDNGIAIAVDNTGSAYVTGLTSSLDFPLMNPIQPVFGGVSDAFVTKVNPAGTALIYSTYLGGSDTDVGFGIAVDNTGSAYVTGQTSSLNFPLMNPIQPVFGGLSDAFVTKVNPAGTALIFSTYLGGSDTDVGFGIAVDNTGSAYVTGQTFSANFPLMNPIQPVFGGSADAFVTKINPAGTALIFSTYLGGSSGDAGRGIAVDNTGSAHVTGFTNSLNFPLMNPIQPVFGGGGADAFVTKVNPAGTALIYSTYLGGNGVFDIGRSIAVDNTGSAYVTGSTSSLNFPLMNPIQPVFGGGGSDAFVTKVNPAGTALIFSTYLGGIGFDVGFSIAVDNTGSAYVTGETSSLNFPLANPIQPVFGGGSFDAFVTKVNPAGTALIFSTYLGGSGDDFGRGIAVDNTGSAYVMGQTSSLNFPLMNPIQPTFGGGISDAFVTKINTNPPITAPIYPQIKVTNQNITAIVYETGSNQ